MSSQLTRNNVAGEPKKLPPKKRELFSGLVYHCQPDVDVITWSNWQIPKNSYLYLAFFVGVLILTPLALFLTSRLFFDLYNVTSITIGTGEMLFALLIILAAWGAVAAMVYYLISLFWTETIKISNDEIRLQYSGPLSPKEKWFPENKIWCLSFERVGNDRDREARLTLNIFDIDDKRQTLAYWLRAEENYQLFLLLKTIFGRRGWSVQSKSDYQPK